MGSSLRGRQADALRQMLRLGEKAGSEPVWKILVYDTAGQDILSPILSVRELRELGVTLHVQLHSERDNIPDVPAVYFCSPSEENLQRIAKDFELGLYDHYHLNFISPISRQKLEDLAAAALQANCIASIQKVFDRYLNFICLEDDLFMLKHQHAESLSYYAMNRGDTNDTEMDAMMDSIVDSLFSLFVTLGNVPIIRSAKGNAAAVIAKKLDNKLRENLWDARNNLFQGNYGQGSAFGFSRPLLIILDRNTDMAIPLHHTWTYQALTHDVLDFSLNRVTVNETAAVGVKSKPKVCELEAKDKFWADHKGSPFPTVAEAIQEELEKYRSSEEDIKKLKSSMGLEGENELVMSIVSDNTQRLTNAVNSLPQLMEKKRLIDMHTSIATGILESIKSRRLDSFFELEEKIMSKTAVEGKAILDLLMDPTAGSPEDKMRLFIIYYICTPQITEQDYVKFENALSSAGSDMSCMTYIKRLKGYSKMSSQYEGGGTKTVSMFSKLMSQGSSFVMEGVKNLVVKRHNLPVTRIVDAAMSNNMSSGNVSVSATIKNDSDLLWFDPRLLRPTDMPTTARSSPFQEAVVFIVGGGNYIEYQNLVDYARQKSSNNTIKIIYGSTNIINATQFLKQLSSLGQELQ